MSRIRIQLRDVLVYLGAHETDLIDELRSEGLFTLDEIAPHEADELRVAQVLTQELGVNAAGVDVALHLRRRLVALEERTRVLVRALEASDAGSRDS